MHHKNIKSCIHGAKDPQPPVGVEAVKYYLLSGDNITFLVLILSIDTTSVGLRDVCVLCSVNCTMNNVVTCH